MDSRILSLLLFAFFLPACAAKNGSSPDQVLAPISEARLEGNNWLLVSYGAPDKPIEALENIQVSVRFNNYEDLGGSAGCNFFAKQYEIDGLQLITDELQRTRFRCPEEDLMIQDAAVLKAMQTVSSIGLDGDFLVIGYDGGELRFIKEPPPPITPLTGTLWQLENWVQGEAVNPVLPGTLITARFDEGLVRGSSGCNSYGTGYKLDGSSFSAGEVEQTEKLCSEKALMDQENAFVDSLKEATHFTLDGESLTISHVTGALQFRRMMPLTEPPFVDTRWRLTAFFEGEQQRLPVDGAAITALFNGSKYSGSTGCNRYNGEYSVDGNIVRMGDELVTEKDCPGAGVMEQERHFLTILRQNHAFLAGVSEEALLLIHDDGALLFTSGR